MKLRNRKTGEIIEVLEKPSFVKRNDDYLQGEVITFNSLAELNAEWEDAPEEPKEYWYLTMDGEVRHTSIPEFVKYSKQIGNYFETKEEAEKAVEKLKAIQRLKSHYIKFKLDFVKNKIDFTYRIDGTLHSSVDEERIIFEDMNLLFGGEE